MLDLADGPLGSRHFAQPEYGVAFARGLGRAACAKHFPGLGSTPVSTDEARVYGVLRSAGSRAVPRRDPGRRPVRDGRPRDLPAARPAPRLARAEDVPAAAPARLRGVAVTDSLGVLGSPYAPYWARLALTAGADLVLTTSARDARRIVDALVPLARAGELDAKLVRVLRYRRSLGVPAPSP